MIKHYIRAIRPRQWTKNLILFAGIIFAQRFFEVDAVLRTFLAFVDFCLLSSSIYLINDLKDVESDRLHPIKKFRPVANGNIGIKSAWTYAAILSLTALGLAYFLGYHFFLAASLYYVMMVLYSFFLKHLVILDIMVIAGGFVIRAIAGALAVDVTISSWLLVCATLLALFLVLSKRRHEVILLGEDAKGHRKILEEYGAKFLDQMISVVTAATLMSYILYTMDPVTIEKFDTSKLILTTPFVLYGIFRYLYLVYQKNMGGRPEEVLLNDLPIIGAVVLYVITAVIIIY